MGDDGCAGTRHSPLLGVGAALGPNAELYARQQRALEAARRALDDPCVRTMNEQIRASVAAYLDAMCEEESC